MVCSMRDCLANMVLSIYYMNGLVCIKRRGYDIKKGSLCWIPQGFRFWHGEFSAKLTGGFPKSIMDCNTLPLMRCLTPFVDKSCLHCVSKAME